MWLDYPFAFYSTIANKNATRLTGSEERALATEILWIRLPQTWYRRCIIIGVKDKKDNSMSTWVGIDVNGFEIDSFQNNHDICFFVIVITWKLFLPTMKAGIPRMSLLKTLKNVRINKILSKKISFSWWLWIYGYRWFTNVHFLDEANQLKSSKVC